MEHTMDRDLLNGGKFSLRISLTSPNTEEVTEEQQAQLWNWVERQLKPLIAWLNGESFRSGGQVISKSNATFELSGDTRIEYQMEVEVGAAPNKVMCLVTLALHFLHALPSVLERVLNSVPLEDLWPAPDLSGLSLLTVTSIPGLSGLGLGINVDDLLSQYPFGPPRWSRYRDFSPGFPFGG